MKVIHVNSDKDLKKFNKKIKKGKMMVVFVANWCGHCQHLKPIWKKMEKVMKKAKCVKNSMIVMIYSEYKDKVNINSNCNGFPTIRMYQDGKSMGDWKGDWSQKGVLVGAAKEFLGERGRKRTRTKGKRKKRTQRKRRKMGRKRTQRKRTFSI